MFNPIHCGLFFGEDRISTARKHARRAPFIDAWAQLRGTAPVRGLAAVQWDGLRWRLDDDASAGEKAVVGLGDTAQVTEDTPYHAALAQALIYAQCVELIRTHPAATPAQHARQRDFLWEQVSTLNERVFEPSLVELLWQAAMNMAAGVVLEREPIFAAAAQVYRDTVDTEIHPEGYFPKIVQAAGNTLTNQVMAVQALVLMAEIAAAAGVNLWAYHNRGVSVLTASTYSLYYYFYPEKWQWEPGLDLDFAQPLFRTHGGFLEMVNGRYDKPLRAVRLILKDIRPVYDFAGGGLPGLTHGVPERRGLFG